MSTILTPFLDDYDVIVYQGDCIGVMRELPEASVDAIVTDPPYGLEFMGKDWDSFAAGRSANYSRGGSLHDPEARRGKGGAGPNYTARPAKRCAKCGKQAWSGSPCQCDHPAWEIDNSALHAFQAFSEAWAREAYRVLKPGGHLLAFAGTRTYHRMASGVEDAGFEIRDCIAWMYGSGFPKSLDVSKAIDKAAGAEREVTREVIAGIAPGYGNAVGGPKPLVQVRDNPVSEAALEWSGWGTALKPAFEPIVVARKPLIGTVAENVQAHGTGALNIDACRISVTDDEYEQNFSGARGHDENRKRAAKYGMTAGSTPAAGRWPANVALDETAATMLDEQTPDLAKAWSAPSSGNASDRTYGGSIARSLGAGHMPQQYGDSGGASRFFYTAKASRQDRNVGGLADNTHPTVKPTDLMRWLIRLVTPPGGIILDPFGGSGSTGLAARAENVRCILIEREHEYLQIIKDRLAQLSLFSVPEDAA